MKNMIQLFCLFSAMFTETVLSCLKESVEPASELNINGKQKFYLLKSMKKSNKKLETMKTIIRMLFLCGIISLMAFCCERDKDVYEKSMEINKEIIGDWENMINNKDILFINDTLIRRIDTAIGEPYHAYIYTILPPDSIKIEYKGFYYIACPETTFHMSLDQQEMILTIENLNTYFPEYPGDTFKKITDK